MNLNSNCELNSISVTCLGNYKNIFYSQNEIQIKKRGSIHKKVKRLENIIPENNFNYGFLQNIQQKRTRTITLSDFWGNKEKYLIKTGYFKAYKVLQKIKEKEDYLNKLSANKIFKTLTIDRINQNVKIKKSCTINNLKSTDSNTLKHQYFSKKCAELSKVLTKMLAKPSNKHKS